MTAYADEPQVARKPPPAIRNLGSHGCESLIYSDEVSHCRNALLLSRKEFSCSQRATNSRA